MLCIYQLSLSVAWAPPHPVDRAWGLLLALGLVYSSAESSPRKHTPPAAAALHQSYVQQSTEENMKNTHNTVYDGNQTRLQPPHNQWVPLSGMLGHAGRGGATLLSQLRFHSTSHSRAQFYHCVFNEEFGGTASASTSHTSHNHPSSPVPLGHVTTRRPGYVTKSSLRFQRNLILLLFWGGLLFLILSNVILTYMLIFNSFITS